MVGRSLALMGGTKPGVTSDHQGLICPGDMREGMGGLWENYLSTILWRHLGPKTGQCPIYGHLLFGVLHLSSGVTKDDPSSQRTEYDFVVLLPIFFKAG